MISGKPQAHTRAEGGDGGGPKAEAHAKNATKAAHTLNRQLTRGPRNGRGDHTHTHAERTYVGKVQTKVGVGYSQRLRRYAAPNILHTQNEIGSAWSERREETRAQ